MKREREREINPTTLKRLVNHWHMSFARIKWRKKNCTIIFRWNLKITIKFVSACERINFRCGRTNETEKNSHFLSRALQLACVERQIKNNTQIVVHLFVLLAVVLCVAHQISRKTIRICFFRNANTHLFMFEFLYNFQFIYGVISSILDFNPFQFHIVALSFNDMDFSDAFELKTCGSWITLIFCQSKRERETQSEIVFTMISQDHDCNIRIPTLCGTFAMAIVVSIVHHM